MTMDTISSFRGDYDFLSNFHPCVIRYKGSTYNSVETAFQAQKNPDAVDMFRNMSTPEAKKANRLPIINPGLAKRIGRSIRLRPDWEEAKDQIMFELLTAKFTQNQELRQRLLDTGKSLLIEGNTWHDNYWGFCKCPVCALEEHKNKLGVMLMEIRTAFDADRDPLTTTTYH